MSGGIKWRQSIWCGHDPDEPQAKMRLADQVTFSGRFRLHKSWFAEAASFTVPQLDSPFFLCLDSGDR